MCSRAARCLRQEAQVEVNSIGSSNDLICVLVSWIVLLSGWRPDLSTYLSI